MITFLFLAISAAWFILIIPQMRFTLRIRKELRKFRKEIEKRRGL